MTFLQQADQLVREHLANKELWFTDSLGNKVCRNAHLEHYLRVLDLLEEHIDVDLWGDGMLQVLSFLEDYTPKSQIFFNLTDGKPASEQDAEKFIELVS